MILLNAVNIFYATITFDLLIIGLDLDFCKAVLWQCRLEVLYK